MVTNNPSTTLLSKNGVVLATGKIQGAYSCGSLFSSMHDPKNEVARKEMERKARMRKLF